MKKQNHIKFYSNGATIRMHNKRISFKQDEKSIVIGFSFAEENANTPACLHVCHRGKVRETSIKMSNEAMEALVLSFIQFKKKKYIETVNKINTEK